MAKLVAFYSRANENYFGGNLKHIEIGNTETIAKMIAQLTGADLFKIEQKFLMQKIIKHVLHKQKRIYQITLDLKL